jgi:phytoene dehydrogenase-like protein
VTDRYDAAIIGAGADGLTAAALLARAGQRVVVLERRAEPGGRLVTREFHPGFRAAPFADALPPVPDDLFRRLDLARHGAWRAPAADAVALWPDRFAVVPRRFEAEAEARRAAALAHAALPEPPAPPRWNILAKPAADIWPADDWTRASLADLAEADAPLLLDAPALDPFAPGTALRLLAAPDAGPWRGALGGLGAALLAAAREAGAQIACNREVGDIRSENGRVTALATAEGGDIAARAVLSTLDLKRTFLSLFPWSALPSATVKQIGAFRMQGSTARLLCALSVRPRSPLLAALPRGAVHVMPDARALVDAHAAWRAGIISEKLPLTLRFPSRVDPGLAPTGGAVMTVSIGAVPHTLFDGVWTNEKRNLLTARALDAIEQVFPGIGATIVGLELLTPPDIEQQLGATAGDLDGGEIAPDQMFAFRPGLSRKSPRTPVQGLYLAGPSSAAGPLGTCAAGAIAADALLADLRGGTLP